MKMLTLFGRCLPFERETKAEAYTRFFREAVQPHAATPAAMESAGLQFNINHDRRRVVQHNGSDVSIRFFRLSSGVYTIVCLPASHQLAQEAISRRAAWTGWSVSFDESRTQFTLDSARNVRRIHRLSLTGVSLCIGTTPAYPDTWIETDPARASARAQQDEEAYWVARAGPIARTAWAKADDELPPQARWLENLIEKHDFYGFRRDPDRSYKRAAGLLSA